MHISIEYLGMLKKRPRTLENYNFEDLIVSSFSVALSSQIFNY